MRIRKRRRYVEKRKGNERDKERREKKIGNRRRTKGG